MAVHSLAPQASPRKPRLRIVSPEPQAGAARIIVAPPAATPAREELPVLKGDLACLREVEAGDAGSLFSKLAVPEVARFISAPPDNVAGFARFAAWSVEQRRLNQYCCFAVVSYWTQEAIGIFQVRALEPSWQTAEWGFAIEVPSWGKGIFAEGARLVADFAFDVLKVHRLEARAACENGRGVGACRKVGMIEEGVLRASLLKDGRYLDQFLFSILHTDWYAGRPGRLTSLDRDALIH